MSYVSALYHIVFSTKERESTIVETYKNDLYRFIWNILKRKKCPLYRINGMGDHVHILIDLNPTIALSDIVRDIKSSASGFLKIDNRFPHFKGWSSEYYAATLSYKDKDRAIEYIKNQEQHHGRHDFIYELDCLCAQIGLKRYDN